MLGRLQGVVPILALLLLWEAVARAGIVPTAYLPPPTTVLQTFARMMGSGELLRENALTLQRAFVGFGLGTLIGLGLGIVCASSRWMYGLLEPLVEFLRPMPSAATIPLAILFLGLGAPTFTAIVAYATAWPVFVNTLDALRGVDTLLEDTGKAYGLAPWERLWEIRLPHAAPAVATGMRVSLGIALISTVTAEMLIGQGGLGYLMLTSGLSLRIPQMYAVIVLAGLNGFVVNALFVAAARRALRWHEGLAAMKEAM